MCWVGVLLGRCWHHLTDLLTAALCHQLQVATAAVAESDHHQPGGLLVLLLLLLTCPRHVSWVQHLAPQLLLPPQ